MLDTEILKFCSSVLHDSSDPLRDLYELTRLAEGTDERQLSAADRNTSPDSSYAAD
jgi:hypothetical protein